MSRYLAMLKVETEKNSQTPVSPSLSKLPKAPFDSFGSREDGRIYEKNYQSGSNEFLPVWCSHSCSCLELLDLPDGKILGCVHASRGWGEAWSRLSSMERCTHAWAKVKKQLRGKHHAC